MILYPCLVRLCRSSGVTISYHNRNTSLDDLVPLVSCPLPVSTVLLNLTENLPGIQNKIRQSFTTVVKSTGTGIYFFLGVGGINLVEYERNGNFLSSVNETKADLPLVVPFLQPVFWPFSSSYRCPPYQLSRGYFYFCFQYTVYR